MNTSHNNHRNPIGFKDTNTYSAEVQQQPVHDNDLSFEQMMKQKGFEQAFKILSVYFDHYAYPLMSAESRDEKFFDQLRQIKIRFFAPVIK